MIRFKNAAKALLRKSGYDIVRYPIRGKDPYDDMRLLLGDVDNPMIFDVGANEGQTVDKFRHRFPKASIHSFEPSPSTYSKLRNHCSAYPGVNLWNFGVGATKGSLPLFENVAPDMSSFLPLSEFGWGNVEKTTMVDVITLDGFADQHAIEHIHVLKSDTQGFELEVLKGATRLMEKAKISMIYLEIIFSDMYKGLTPLDEILGFLARQGFLLVGFYTPHYQRGLLSWSDALFVHSKCYNQAAGKLRDFAGRPQGVS